MKLKSLVGAGALVAALAGCESGDINIDAPNNATTDNSVDNSVDGDGNTIGGGGGGNPDTNPCASYTAGGVLKQGSYSAPNCTYGSDFTDLTNPITTTDLQVTFADLENDGVHIFSGSLVVGRSYDNDAELAEAGITEGGDGAAIRIDAGATLAFRSSEDYMVINRGSQVFAEGTADAPITITSVSDAVDGTVEPEAVSEWGGLIINGFGVSNKCAYTGNRGEADFATADCHIAAEGKDGSAQTYYGGTNDDDNSGVLQYFIVKHTGAQVAPDNELNGISFNAVGNGTTVSYIQAYSTYDDGIEMFGGSVNIDHYIALYVRDDSIDIDEGYNGTISHALVIQSETDGQQCLESDGIGSYDAGESDANADKIAQGLNSAATLEHVTCIVSPVASGTHGVGAGLRVREGHFAKIYNSLVTTAYQADGVPNDTDENQCLRIDDTETLQGAVDGDVVIESSIFACQDLTKGDDLPNGDTLLEFMNATNATMKTAEAGENPTAEADANLVILNGFYSLPIGDVVINGGAATITPADSAEYVGAVVESDDWTAGWSFGLHSDNQAQPLWFLP